MVIGFIGITWMLVGACALLLGVILHLATLHIPDLVRAEGVVQAEGIDMRGSLAAIQVVPGLLALILFHTFNNFLGGVFMSLMDPYGLQLVSVQVWGVLWGVLSLGFIVTLLAMRPSAYRSVAAIYDGAQVEESGLLGAALDMEA